MRWLANEVACGAEGLTPLKGGLIRDGMIRFLPAYCRECYATYL